MAKVKSNQSGHGPSPSLFFIITKRHNHPGQHGVHREEASPSRVLGNVSPSWIGNCRSTHTKDCRRIVSTCRPWCVNSHQHDSSQPQGARPSSQQSSKSHRSTRLLSFLQTLSGPPLVYGTWDLRRKPKGTP